MHLVPLLERSRATESFKADAVAYADGRTSLRVLTVRHAPRVKVLRVLAQLLSAEPELDIVSVRIDALTGCADFRGAIEVESASGGTRTFEFVWDCQWRAQEEGWVDAFGFPDQIRAAHTFGWRCFALWRERAASPMRAGLD